MRHSGLRPEVYQLFDEGNKLGIVVEEGSKKHITNPLRFVVAADKTAGDLDAFLEVHQRVPPKFDLSTYANACVVEGDDVLTLRREDCGAEQLVVHTAQIPEKPFGTASCGRRRGCNLPSLVRRRPRGGGLGSYATHVLRSIEVQGCHEKEWQALGKLAWRREARKRFFS